MAGKRPLKPDDFPVHVDKNKIKKNDGEPIAESSDEGTAEDIADRLNENEYQREEDRWSA